MTMAASTFETIEPNLGELLSNISTSLISLRTLFHSFALEVSLGYPGFLRAGMFRTIFKVDRTASQIISRN